MVLTVLVTIVEKSDSGTFQVDTAKALLETVNDHEAVLDKQKDVVEKFESKFLPLWSSHAEVVSDPKAMVQAAKQSHASVAFIQNFLDTWIKNAGTDVGIPPKKMLQSWQYLAKQMKRFKVEDGDETQFAKGLRGLNVHADSLATQLLEKHYSPSKENIQKQFLHTVFPEAFPSCDTVFPNRKEDGTPTNTELATVVTSGQDRDALDLDMFAEVCTASGTDMAEISLLQGTKQVTDLRLRALAINSLEKFPFAKDIDPFQYQFNSRYSQQLAELKKELNNFHTIRTSTHLQDNQSDDMVYLSGFGTAIEQHFDTILGDFRSHNLSAVKVFEKRIEDMIPTDLEVWAVRVPNEEAIKNKLLNNPHRPDLSRIWNTGTEVLAKMKKAFVDLGKPLTEGKDGEITELQENLVLCKQCVGLTACCSVIYDTGPEVATQAELESLIDDVTKGLANESIEVDGRVLKRMKEVKPKALTEAAAGE